MNDSGNLTSIIITLIGLLSVAIGAIIWFGKWAVNRLSKDLIAHTKSGDKQAATNVQVKKTMASFEVYLKDRNGRDAEVHKTLMESQKKVTETLYKLPPAIQKIADDSLTKINQQNIKAQTVEHQEVKEAVIKKK